MNTSPFYVFFFFFLMGIKLRFSCLQVNHFIAKPSSPQPLRNCFPNFSSLSISLTPHGSPTKKSRVLTLFIADTRQVLSGNQPHVSKLTWACPLQGLSSCPTRLSPCWEEMLEGKECEDCVLAILLCFYSTLHTTGVQYMLAK